MTKSHEYSYDINESANKEIFNHLDWIRSSIDSLYVLLKDEQNEAVKVFIDMIKVNEEVVRTKLETYISNPNGREKLQAGLDYATHHIVLYNEDGDIRAIIPNGKTKIKTDGPECEECMARDISFAAHLAAMWNG